VCLLECRLHCTVALPESFKVMHFIRLRLSHPS